MAQLSVKNITKEYPSRGERLQVLRGISFELEAGENLAILGPSGSGKSTLLHILGTLEPPTSGEVRLNGEDPFALNEPEQARFRNQQIGFVFQDHHLLPQCTVLENVLIPTIANPDRQADYARHARRLLDAVGLADRLEHRPAELSGGERQRAAIARALICQPKLLLADEPTGNLDRTTARRVADLLLELQQAEGTMLVVVTHSQELAARLARRGELDEGRLVPLT
jgi:lipoprotein-releasing system ATP-binding protein